MTTLTDLNIPEGTSHTRKNIKKGTRAFFKQLNTKDYEIHNKGRWERYKDHTRGIVPISEIYKEAKPQKKVVQTLIPEIPTYEPQVSTFKERVFEIIPEPVLRQLIHYYENHDVVEVELNVKMTSVIKG